MEATQAPFTRSKPLSQVRPHALAAQVAWLLAGCGQTLPQAPQWLGSVERSAHWPLQSVPLPQPL